MYIHTMHTTQRAPTSVGDCDSRSSLSKRTATTSDDASSHHIVYTLHERIDVEAGMRLLSSPPMRDMSRTDTAAWRGYSNAVGLAKQLGGYLPVRYFLRQDKLGFGRYSCEVSVQGCVGIPMYARMMREVRAHLAASTYWDVDMVNSSPALLLQTFDMYAIDAPLLRRYVEHRDECLREVMDACEVGRDAAKALFIRLTFFGCVDAWEAGVGAAKGAMDERAPAWVHDLRGELHAASTELLMHKDFDALKAYVEARKGAASGNRIGKTMSIMLQTKERHCLDALVEAVQLDGRTVGALIFDGIHVEKEPGIDGPDGISMELLARWRAHVRRKTGYDVALVVKAFETNPAWIVSEVEGDTWTEERPTDFWDDEWMSGTGTSMLSYEEMKALWEQRSFKVVAQGKYVREERSQRLIYSRNQLIDAYEHLRYTIVAVKDDGDVKVRRYPFIFGGPSSTAPASWLVDPQIRSYKFMGMYPPPAVGPQGSYNTWDGFNAARYRPTKPVDTNSDAVRAYVTHITRLLHGNATAVDYVLDWIAQIFQEPGIKRGIALILKGGEGAGKNRLVDLLKLMVGEDKFFETAKPSASLYGRFTSSRRDRFLIAINEASGNENFAAADVIKDMITATTFVCEGKCKDAITLPCHARFIFTTNSDNILRVNPDSRRYVVFDVSNELAGNVPYFKALSQHIDDEHGRHELYRALMERDISQVDWVNERPITEYYQRMVDLNLDKEFQYLKTQIVLPAHYDRKPIVSLPARQLFEGFRDWLVDSTTTGSTRYDTNEVKFGGKIGSLVTGSEAMQGVRKRRNERGWVYIFDIEHVCAAMLARKWITAEDFDARRPPRNIPEAWDQVGGS